MTGTYASNHGASKMKQAFLAAVLIFTSSVAFADTTSALLDGEKVRSMSAEEYDTAVRGAPDVNVRDKDGWTPLHFAAAVGTPDNIAALAKAGADVEARGKDGRTPMHDAAKFGRPANIAILVIAGARVDARDEEWRTPLHDAAEFGPPANIAMLISAGANVNARDKHGLTPLHLAAWKGTPDNIAALLDGGASGIIRNSDGKTPFDLARRNDKVKGTAAYRALNDAQENVSLDGQSGRPPEASSIESNNDR